MKYLFVLLSTLAMHVVADVKSNNGVIEFDSNSDSQVEMILNQTGLGIGVSPSESLHVNGNAIVNQLSIGTVTATSNLNLGGTLGYSSQTLSVNATLGDHSLVLVDTSSDNIVLSLPAATTAVGRQYLIKKISLENQLWIESEETIDGYDSRVLLQDSALPFTQLMSDGSAWYILSKSSEVEVVIAADNLVAWWKLDESSGTSVSDSSLYSNNGTLGGGMTFSSNVSTGVFGQALTFDGADDDVTFATPSNALNAGNNISVSLWIKGDPVQPITYARPISKFGVGAGWELQMNNANPDVQLRVDTSAGTNQLSSSTTVLDNNWHHYVFSLSGSSRIIYLDGNEVVNSTYNYGAGFANASAITLGKANNSSRYFKGSIDDVRIYSRVLTGSEVAKMYQQSQ